MRFGPSSAECAVQKAAEGMRDKIKEAIELLQLGMQVYKLKTTQAGFEQRADELAKQIEAEGILSMKERYTARQERQAALEMAQSYANLAQQHRIKLDELYSAQHIEQMQQHQITHGLLLEGFEDNRAQHGETHTMLRVIVDAVMKRFDRLDSNFERAAAAGERAHQVSSDSCNDMQ